MAVSKKNLARLADRIETVPAYSESDLDATLVKHNGKRTRKRGVKVILVDQAWRAQIAKAVRAMVARGK